MQELCGRSPMRPKPLMATLIFFAWVTCFEPVVPCGQQQQQQR